MTICAHIIEDSPVQHWGLTPRQRILRVLASAGVTDIVDDIASLPASGSVILLRGDYLYDDRVVNYMVDTPDVLLLAARQDHSGVVAARVGVHLAGQAVDIMEKTVNDPSLPGVKAETLQTLFKNGC